MQRILTINDLDGVSDLKEFLEEHDFVGEIENWALEAARSGCHHINALEWNRPRLKRAFHPSSISGDCDFKLWLDVHGAAYRSKTSSSLQGIFDVGTAVHGMLDYYFVSHAKQNNYVFHPEIGFKPRYIKDDTGNVDPFTGERERWVHSDTADELQLAGHADGLCVRTFKQQGEKVRLKLVFEFKTISSSGFRKLTKPHGYYIQQVHAYMACLDAPATILLYINKDNAAKVAFPVVFDQKFWSPKADRLRRIKKEHDDLQDVAKKPSAQCWQCGYLEVCKPKLPKRSSRGFGAPEI